MKEVLTTLGEIVPNCNCSQKIFRNIRLKAVLKLIGTRVIRQENQVRSASRRYSRCNMKYIIRSFLKYRYVTHYGHYRTDVHT